MAWSKASRQSRGYGAEWDRIREQVLERDGYMCHRPDCKGQLLPAHEVDHIKPKALYRSGKVKGNPDDPSNLRSVNRNCHKRLTLQQRGYRPAVRIGVDGYPIEE